MQLICFDGGMEMMRSNSVTMAILLLSFCFSGCIENDSGIMKFYKKMICLTLLFLTLMFTNVLSSRGGTDVGLHISLKMQIYHLNYQLFLHYMDGLLHLLR